MLRSLRTTEKYEKISSIYSIFEESWEECEVYNKEFKVLLKKEYS